MTQSSLDLLFIYLFSQVPSSLHVFLHMQTFSESGSVLVCAFGSVLSIWWRRETNGLQSCHVCWVKEARGGPYPCGNVWEQARADQGGLVLITVNNNPVCKTPFFSHTLFFFCYTFSCSLSQPDMYSIQLRSSMESRQVVKLHFPWTICSENTHKHLFTHLRETLL